MKLKKETPKQTFSSEICEIYKNIFFTEHLWAIAFSIKRVLWILLKFIEIVWETTMVKFIFRMVAALQSATLLKTLLPLLYPKYFESFRIVVIYTFFI